jgi:hypothetical protein
MEMVIIVLVMEGLTINSIEELSRASSVVTVRSLQRSLWFAIFGYIFGYDRTPSFHRTLFHSEKVVIWRFNLSKSFGERTLALTPI